MKDEKKKRIILESRPISEREFYDIPRLPKHISYRVASKLKEALARPLTWHELATSLALPIDDLIKALNQLIRAGFVGIHPDSDTNDIRFHWAQSVKGEPGLRDLQSPAAKNFRQTTT